MARYRYITLSVRSPNDSKVLAWVKATAKDCCNRRNVKFIDMGVSNPYPKPNAPKVTQCEDIPAAAVGMSSKLSTGERHYTDNMRTAIPTKLNRGSGKSTDSALAWLIVPGRANGLKWRLSVMVVRRQENPL